MGSGNIAHGIQANAAQANVSISITSKAHAQNLTNDPQRNAMYVKQLQAITNDVSLKPEQKIAKIREFNAKWARDTAAISKPKKLNTGFFKSWSFSKK